MEQLESHLKSLHQKVNLLIKQNQLLKKKNELLASENEAMQKSLAEKDTEVKKLEAQIEVLKINAGGLTKSDKKLLEKRIDGYLREIEKCLAQLNA